MRRTVMTVLLTVGTAASAAGQDAGQEGTSERTPTVVDATTYFEFHSDPWVNLHHFLYQWARADQGIGSGRSYVEVPERDALRDLPTLERRAWRHALEFYRQSLAELSRFDDAMLEQKTGLLGLDGEPGARPPDAIPGISVALTTAMPVYLEHWWPAHDRANRDWIAEVLPDARRHEDGYVALTERVYGSDWSGGPRRIDASAYANPRGGYTSAGHTVIYSRDPGIRGLYALEILIHEVQHTRDIGGRARARLSAAFEEAGVEPPRNLWHAIIFATAGAYAGMAAEVEGLQPHEPYWIREGFDGFQGWDSLVPVVQDVWLPVIRGQRTTEEAFRALVERFREPRGGPS